jgi:hypothetical protein
MKMLYAAAKHRPAVESTETALDSFMLCTDDQPAIRPVR